jgi:hypothetical protein
MAYHALPKALAKIHSNLHSEDPRVEKNGVRKK